MKDEDSYWKYAVLKENKIIISNNSVGVSVPVNLNIVSSQEMISASGLNERLNERMPEVNKSDQAVSQKAGSALGSLQSTGTLKVIVVRVEFPDKKMQVSSNLNYFNQILNSTGGAKDYFAEASYGKLTVNFDISQKVYSLPFSASYYSNPETSLIVNNAMNSANADIDFSQYDAVIVVHAGAGEEITANPFDYWSQRFYGLNLNFDSRTFTSATVVPEYEPIPFSIKGVVVHEFMHELGLVDLYNTLTGSTVVGRWDVMDGGSWLNYGNTPSHPSAWSKEELDWLVPRTRNADSTITINQLETNEEAYIITSQKLVEQNEYFIIENRKKTGFDAYLPEAGILIWHIDNFFVNNYRDSNAVNVFNVKGVVPEKPAGQLNDAAYSREDSQTEFTPFTKPNSSTNIGIPTNIFVTNISSSGDVMELRFEVKDISRTSIENVTPANNSEISSSPFYLSFNTNKLAQCRFSTISGQAFSFMSIMSETSGFYHRQQFEISLDGRRYSFYFKCLDEFGKIAETRISYTTKDTIPLEISIILPEVKTYNISSIKFFVNSSKRMSALKKSIDTGIFSTVCIGCVKYASTTVFGQGNHTLTFSARDYSGREQNKSVKFAVDSIQPFIMSYYSAGAYSKAKINFSIRYTEVNLMSSRLIVFSNESSLEFDLNCLQGINKICSKEIDLSGFDGKKIVYRYELSDNFFRRTTRNISTTVDSVKPEIAINSPTEGAVYNLQRINISVSLSEKVKVLKRAVDGYAFTNACLNCNNFTSSIWLTRGNHTLHFLAVDNAGNTVNKSTGFRIGG